MFRLIPNPVLWFSPFGLLTMSFEVMGQLNMNNRQFMDQVTHAELLAQDAKRRLDYVLGRSK